MLVREIVFELCPAPNHNQQAQLYPEFIKSILILDAHQWGPSKHGLPLDEVHPSINIDEIILTI